MQCLSKHFTPNHKCPPHYFGTKELDRRIMSGFLDYPPISFRSVLTFLGLLLEFWKVFQGFDSDRYSHDVPLYGSVPVSDCAFVRWPVLVKLTFSLCLVSMSSPDPTTKPCSFGVCVTTAYPADLTPCLFPVFLVKLGLLNSFCFTWERL